MEFQQPITLTQLEPVFAKAKAEAEEECRWYKGHRKWTRAGSYFTRIVAALGLGLGIIAPMFPDKHLPFGGTWQLQLGASSGYVALVVAGFALLLDQIFMWSRSWSRYMGAEARIRTLILIAEFDWLKLKASPANGAGTHEKQVQEALNFFQKFGADVRAVVEAETLRWESQLDEAQRTLAKKLLETTSAVQKLQDDELKERNKQRRDGESS